MPAGVDLFDWYPRKGSTGDDRYDLPDDDRRVQAGTTSYSSNPTFAEIAAGGYINQMVAFANFRMQLYADSINNGTSYTNFPYAQPHYSMLAGLYTPSLFSMSGLKSLIDTIRAQENLSPFPWTISFPAKARRQQIIELRKALSTDRLYCPWPQSLSNGRNSGFARYDKSTYPAATGGTFTGTASATRLNAGQQYYNGTHIFSQLRQIVDLHLPSYCPTINSLGAYFGFTRVQSVTGDPAKACTLEMYLSNTYVSGTPVAGDWARLDNYINSLSILTSQQNDQEIAAGGSALGLTPGSNYSTYFCTNEERTNTDQNGGSFYYSIARNYISVTGKEALLLYT